MGEVDLAQIILLQMARALDTITRRFEPVTAPDYFTQTDLGMEKLDAICMQLIALGESVKNLDKVTGGGLLSRYSQIEWKKVMGMRDVISHHYFDMDAEIVYSVCLDYVPELRTVVGQMIVDLSLSGTGSERSPH
jgi:uncharacterized protein with HEPN domain